MQLNDDNIRQNLLKLRVKSGLTQVALAPIIGTYSAFINKVERGTRHPSLPLVYGYSKYFGVPMEVICDGDVVEVEVMKSKKQLNKIN
jgi:DNA-binding XRE family transcriptional regulator